MSAAAQTRVRPPARHPGRDRERALITRAQAGCARSRREMLLRNDALVVSVARPYLPLTHQSSTLDFDDLLQEGRRALAEALDRFDPALGNRFSTYATWWVRQAVGRLADNQARSLRVPIHRLQMRRQVARAEDRLRTSGLPPTDDAVAAEIGATQRDVAAARAIPHDARSLDAPVTDAAGAGATPGDAYGSAHAAMPDTDDDPANLAIGSLEAAGLRSLLPEALGRLTDVQREVVLLRSGLDPSAPHGATYPEIARRLGVSPQRARNAHAAALRRLRKALPKTLTRPS